MDDQSRELGLNNPRRRAQQQRAAQAAAGRGADGRPAGAPVAPMSASAGAVRGEAVTVPVGASRGVAAGASGAVPPASVPAGTAAADTAGNAGSSKDGAPGVSGSEADAATTTAPDTSAAADAAGEASADGEADAGKADGDEAADPVDPADASRRPTVRAARAAVRPTAKKPRWTRGKIAALSVAAVLAVLAVALMAGFGWLRWLSADDAADVRGTWYLAGTATPIIITEDRIHLTEDVSYRYTLDTHDKTIQFSFGDLSGSGRYRFSLDRDELALVDGAFSGGDTLSDDIGWTIHALWENLLGGRLAPAEKSGKGVTLLSRTPTATVPSLPDEDGDDAPAAANDASSDDGSQVIEDDTLGDLAGTLPADDAMSAPDDKPADAAPADDAATAAEDASGEDDAGTADDAGDAAADTATADETA
ncbi:hypothetical protein VIN30_02680 [Adlercreutzia sp. R7]|uniref:Uncharacterized protein n=1 Tax=Adlercreutzia wanghongyangiae TaxID=3111451 RepID=A0ABU6IFZ6_9ACTN|nr:hypothetical protein [Adlercreutzia sp. R7]